MKEGAEVRPIRIHGNLESRGVEREPGAVDCVNDVLGESEVSHHC